MGSMRAAHVDGLRCSAVRLSSLAALSAALCLKDSVDSLQMQLEHYKSQLQELQQVGGMHDA